MTIKILRSGDANTKHGARCRMRRLCGRIGSGENRGSHDVLHGTGLSQKPLQSRVCEPNSIPRVTGQRRHRMGASGVWGYLGVNLGEVGVWAPQYARQLPDGGTKQHARTQLVLWVPTRPYASILEARWDSIRKLVKGLHSNLDGNESPNPPRKVRFSNLAWEMTHLHGRAKLCD